MNPNSPREDTGAVTTGGTESNDGDLEAAVLHRYRRRYKTQDAIVSGFDFALGLLVRSRRVEGLPSKPARILLANAGHLGDAVISTALFGVLKRAFPDASLGYLTGNYARAVVDRHPLLDRTHYLDHWAVSRTKGSRIRKAATYYSRELPDMVRELKEAAYDVAFDLHGWFPNYIPLLWRSGIPLRVGFTRMGFAPMLTHKVHYAYDRRHELDHQLDLLRPWNLAPEALSAARPTLAPVDRQTMEDVNRLLGISPPYAVLHPASSSSVRDWTQEGWSNLGHSLLRKGIKVVITGAGPRDQAIANAICVDVPGAVSAVNRLTWQQLMALLAGATRVYSVETSIGHAAAALNRPVTSIYGGMADHLHWAPFGAAVVTHAVPCSPCFDKRGCDHRACLLNITVEDIHAAGGS